MDFDEWGDCTQVGQVYSSDLPCPGPWSYISRHGAIASPCWQLFTMLSLGVWAHLSLWFTHVKVAHRQLAKIRSAADSLPSKGRVVFPHGFIECVRQGG